MAKETHVGDLILFKGMIKYGTKGSLRKLTKKQYKLLSALASKPGRIFPREELLALVWGPEVVVELRTIDAHVVKLRKHLQEALIKHPTLETVWGIGYCLKI